MIGDELQQTLDRFEKAARNFLTDPGVLTAMDLDERTGQLRRVCAARLAGQPLNGRLFDLQRAARSADPDLVRVLFEEVCRDLTRQGLWSRAP